MFGSKSISHRDFKLVKSKKASVKKGVSCQGLAPISNPIVERDLVSQILAPRTESEAPLLAQNPPSCQCTDHHRCDKHMISSGLIQPLKLETIELVSEPGKENF